MKLAILLPGFAPDMYWVMAAMQADRVIIDDTSPWSRKSRTHRYQVRTPQGVQWLNIPVNRVSGDPLYKASIESDQNWTETHMRTLSMNYRNSMYFDFYEAEIEAIYQEAAQKTNLLDACLTATSFWFKLLYIDFNYTLASKSNDWNPDPDILSKQIGATSLFLEHSSRHFQRQPVHTPIEIIPHPTYRQHFGGFFEGCGILDYIFSMEPGSLSSTK